MYCRCIFDAPMGTSNFWVVVVVVVYTVLVPKCQEQSWDVIHVILYPTCIVSSSNCPGSWKSITDLIAQTNEPSIQYQHSLHLIPLLNVVSQILWCHHLHIGLLPRQVCQQTNKQMPTSFMQGKLAFLAIKIIPDTTSYYKELTCFVRFQQRDMCFDKRHNKYFGNINSKY